MFHVEQKHLKLEIGSKARIVPCGTSFIPDEGTATNLFHVERFYTRSSLGFNLVDLVYDANEFASPKGPRKRGCHAVARRPRSREPWPSALFHVEHSRRRIQRMRTL
jgi:hypothetical protein